MLMPLTTYALLLAASALAMSELVSRRARVVLVLAGAVEVVLLVMWTWRSQCLAAWCTDRGGLLTWLLGPALLAVALGVTLADGLRRPRRDAIGGEAAGD